MSNKFKRILYILISIILLIVPIILSRIYSTDDITKYVSSKGVYAPIIYILIQMVGQIFAPLSTSALFVVGFLLFQKRALLYLIIIWLISSIINFTLSRKYGKSVLKIFVGDDGIKKIDEITNQLSNRSYFILRLLTFYINDFASYAFGLTNISFLNYIIATVLSIVPWSVIMMIVISNEDSVLTSTIRLFGIMLPLSLISYMLFKRISIRRLIKGILLRIENRKN